MGCDKHCTTCHAAKRSAEFRPRKDSRDGLRSQCCDCERLYKAEWRKRNAARVATYNRKYLTNHAAQRVATVRANNAKSLRRKQAWKERNREKVRAAGRAYVAANRPTMAARWAHYAARKRGALASWRTQFIIDEIYRLARLRSAVSGFEWHVDHIVPLDSRVVCGLHVETNLQIIPGAQNRAKSNRYWPGMP